MPHLMSGLYFDLEALITMAVTGAFRRIILTA